MVTQAEIEKSVRDNLPIAFGTSESVDHKTFLEKYNSLVEYATVVSGPFLGAETMRYQSILLYVSLIFVAASLLRMDKIKIGASDVAVDDRFLVVYSFFIGLMILVFVLKARVDFQRAKLAREHKSEVIADLNHFMKIGWWKTHIQNYFWAELFDVIGGTYKAYSEALAQVTGRPTIYTPTKMNAFTLDRDELRKIPELSTEISAQENHFETLTGALGGESATFEAKAQAILTVAQQSASQPAYPSPTPYDQIVAAYDGTLRKWFDARNKLGSERLDFSIKQLSDSPDIQKLNAMKTVLEQMWSIRRRYAILEIWLPVIFAVGVIVYVRFM